MPMQRFKRPRIKDEALLAAFEHLEAADDIVKSILAGGIILVDERPVSREDAWLIAAHKQRASIAMFTRAVTM